MLRLWGFLLFVIVAIVHLVALFTVSDSVAVPSKWLLMPALLVALLVALPSRRSEIAVWGGLAIVFSWAGDVLLGSPGGFGFVVGLGAFMIAHALYVVLFLRPLRTRRMPWFGYLYVVWWLCLVGVLAPYLGALLIPVALYGLVLGAAAALALGTNRVTAIGGAVFAVSDTILALKLFYPDFSLWQEDFVIMLLYITGQGLIIAGAVRYARAGATVGA